MKIGFDIDDTLCDTNEKLIKYIKEYKPSLIEINKDFKISKRFGISEDVEKSMLKLFYKKAINNAEPYENIVKFLKELHKDGHEIYLISARENINSIKKITKNWLKNNDIYYDKLLLGVKNKAKACSEKSIALYVDDDYRNCLSVSKLGIKTLMYEKEYNQDFKEITRIRNIVEIKNHLSKVCCFDYIDVYNLKKLPKLKQGYRYLDYLGGSKNFRCYIVPKSYPRCNFNNSYKYTIEKSLEPIYQNNGIIICQDNSFALPGFYIISFANQFTSMDLLTDNLMSRVSRIIKYLRCGMRERLGINYVNIYYEEKKDESCNIHFWVMPKTKNMETKLYDFNLKKYLESFEFRKNRDKILEFNEKMKKYFIDINLKEQDI